MKSALFLVLFSIPLLVTVHAFKPAKTSEDRVFYTPPKDFVNYALGFNGFLSSLFWVRAVQDLEVCDQKAKSGERPLYDTTYEDPLERVFQQELPPSRCRKGWVYSMIDLVTDLDPTFQAAYKIGGSFLSVAVDDREGANAILQKGTQYFPEDWNLLFTAAYNEMFEMKNIEAAAELMQKAANRGAPPWIYSLAAGLYTKMGRAQFAKSMLEKVIERKPKGAMAERLKVRLEQINKVLALPPRKAL